MTNQEDESRLWNLVVTFLSILVDQSDIPSQPDFQIAYTVVHFCFPHDYDRTVSALHSLRAIWKQDLPVEEREAAVRDRLLPLRNRRISDILMRTPPPYSIEVVPLERLVEFDVSLPFDGKRTVCTVSRAEFEGQVWRCRSQDYPGLEGSGDTAGDAFQTWISQCHEQEYTAGCGPAAGLEYLAEVLAGPWGKQHPAESAIIRRALAQSATGSQVKGEAT